MNFLAMCLIGSIFLGVRNMFLKVTMTVAGFYRDQKALCIIILITMTTTAIIIHYTSLG